MVRDNFLKIDWMQITPLIFNADEIRIEKMKILNNEIVEISPITWYLSQINWILYPTKDKIGEFVITPNHEDANYDDE